MCWVWKNQPWRPVMPSSREEIKVSLCTRPLHGRTNVMNIILTENTLIWQSTSLTVLTSESDSLIKHTHQIITHLLILSKKLTMKSSKGSSNVDAILDLSPNKKLKISLAPFNHCLYCSFPSPENQENTELFIIFPIHTIQYWHHLLIQPLKRRTTHAHGVCSLLFPFSYQGYPWDRRHLFVTWLKHIEPFWDDPINGQIWLYDSKGKINLLSIQVTTSASQLLGVFTDPLLMLELIYSELTESAHYWSGLMTISFSMYLAFIFSLTIVTEIHGTKSSTCSLPFITYHVSSLQYISFKYLSCISLVSNIKSSSPLLFHFASEVYSLHPKSRAHRWHVAQHIHWGPALIC